MSQAKKLLFYVVLNIVVSAITIIAVLYLWENTKLKNMLFDANDITSEVSSAVATSDGAAPSENLQIEIGEVGGIGNLATEYVRLVRPESESGDTISLQDWSIKDENNHQYNILEQSGVASLDLHGQGAVNIYTKEGDSNPIELYLDLSDPIWQPGETVTLIDPAGEIHDTYVIP